MRFAFCSLFALLCWNVGLYAEAEETRPLKVFVFAGQSNMVGKRSRAEDLPPALRTAQTNAVAYTGRDWKAVQPGATEQVGFGPEISFCDRVATALGEPIGMIKLSVGGTSLAKDWAPELRDSLYQQLRQRVQKAAENRPIEVIGMVWMQGGRDATSPEMAKAYQDNLSAFIQQARQDFANPEMLFVCGRSAAPEIKYPHVRDVRKAQESIDLPGYAWVDCDSIELGSDGVHYTTRGQVASGYMFADAMLKMLKRKPNVSATPSGGNRKE